jgi:hypothetical protein
MSRNPTPTELRAMLSVIHGVLDAAHAGGPMGAPDGVMYAAMMAQGCTLAQFAQITSATQSAGLITRSGDLIHITDRGRQKRDQLAAAGGV